MQRRYTSGFENRDTVVEMSRFLLFLLLLALLSPLGGCGTKGPLYMPPPEQQQE